MLRAGLENNRLGRTPGDAATIVHLMHFVALHIRLSYIAYLDPCLQCVLPHRRSKLKKRPEGVTLVGASKEQIRTARPSFRGSRFSTHLYGALGRRRFPCHKRLLAGVFRFSSPRRKVTLWEKWRGGASCAWRSVGASALVPRGALCARAGGGNEGADVLARPHCHSASIAGAVAEAAA